MQPLRFDATRPSAAPARSRPAREARIREIGREIFAAASASTTHPGWARWEARALEWLLRRPAVRSRLFRFVDVLPALATRAEIAAHLRGDLLGDPACRRELPALARLALALGTTLAPAGVLAAGLARRSVRRLARRFIAGESLVEVVAATERLAGAGMGFTIDALGETVTSEDEADGFAARYLALIDALGRQDSRRAGGEAMRGACLLPSPRVEVSIKLSALDPGFAAVAAARARHAVARRLRPILRRAREHGAGVTIDMEQRDRKDLTLAIFRSILDEDEFRDLADVGIVLQAYLRDTENDLDELLGWATRRGVPVRVRLVKGAYWDQEVALAMQRGWPLPVHAEKWQTDAAFERLAARLLESHQVLRPAIASHNVRSLAHAIAVAEEQRLGAERFEIQMLFGMGDALARALVARGLALRIYAPYGPLLPGMAYLIRRLLENTSNESFLLQAFVGRKPLGELLADPAAARPPSPPLPSPVVVDPGEEDAMAEPFANEATTDFSLARNRELFAHALREVRASCGRDHPLVIGGETIRTSRTLESRDPSREAFVVGRVACADAAHVERAVATARGAWPAWRDVQIQERARLLLRAAEIVRRRRFALAAGLVVEVGKPWREADAEVAEAIDFLRFYAREAELLLGRARRRDLPGEENVLLHEPRGVAAIIAPWNFALSILTGMTAAALVTGNVVILKPAEQSPVIGALLFDVLVEAGLPGGVASFLPGIGEEVGARLVEHPDVDTIAFTGSRAVGLGIIERAARTAPGQRTVKRVVAEMGGKNPVLVDADADLDEAVRGVVSSAFGYAGQKCSACSRVIVVERVHERFVARLAAATRSLVVGPADDPATEVGPLIDDEARARVRRYVDLGRRDAVAVCEVDVGELAGCFVGPVVFDRVPPGSALARDEIFGPVLAVLAAPSFVDGLAIANDSDYALTAGVYSRDPEHVALARRELRAGNVYVNRPITGAIVDRQPFGGVGLSGVGSKAGGPDYLRQFCAPRTISENTMRHGLVPEDGGSARSSDEFIP